MIKYQCHMYAHRRLSLILQATYAGSQDTADLRSARNCLGIAHIGRSQDVFQSRETLLLQEFYTRRKDACFLHGQLRNLPCPRPTRPAAMTGKLSTAGRAVPNSLYLSLPPLSKNFKYELLCTNLQHSTAWRHNIHIAWYASASCYSFSLVDMKYA